MFFLLIEKQQDSFNYEAKPMKQLQEPIQNARVGACLRFCENPKKATLLSFHLHAAKFKSYFLEMLAFFHPNGQMVYFQPKGTNLVHLGEYGSIPG